MALGSGKPTNGNNLALQQMCMKRLMKRMQN
jgi:hypothetical protein